MRLQCPWCDELLAVVIAAAVWGLSLVYSELPMSQWRLQCLWCEPRALGRHTVQWLSQDWRHLLILFRASKAKIHVWQNPHPVCTSHNIFEKSLDLNYPTLPYHNSPSHQTWVKYIRYLYLVVFKYILKYLYLYFEVWQHHVFVFVIKIHHKSISNTAQYFYLMQAMTN